MSEPSITRTGNGFILEGEIRFEEFNTWVGGVSVWDELFSAFLGDKSKTVRITVERLDDE